MHKIRGNKWNRRICQWIASLLTVALLINQNSFWVLAEKSTEEVCQCDIHCSVDSVNEACPVCVQDNGRCEGAEDVTDTDTSEEIENLGEGEGDTDADTETVPDTPTDEERGNPDEGSDTTTDEETEASDADEGDTDADTEVVSDVDTENEVDTLPQADEAENINGEDAVSRASEEGTFTDNGIIYRIISDEENNLQVEVTGHEDGTSVSGDLVIPSTASYGAKEYAVVGIGERAFKDCGSLTSVTIPSGVTSIGWEAFDQCLSLTSVIIPDTVISIESYAFIDCRSLTNITLPNGITSIEEGTFWRCHSLTNIVIPKSVTSIGQDAFDACHNLESVTIPEGVTTIGNGAFGNCRSLTSVTIPSSVTKIEYLAFCFCYGLESVTILNDKVGIGIGSVWIGGSEEIELGQAFWDCTSLNSFRIAVSENITGTPTFGPTGFDGCDTSDFFLTLLTEDGTTELSSTTTPTLAEAVAVYDAADGAVDGKWYDWKLLEVPDTPDVPDITGYPVTINVNLDDSVWSDCGKSFVLSADNGTTFITDLTNVSNGTYTIYDITGAADSVGYVNTGVTVEVKDVAAQAEINYYSVTFYDGDTIFAGRIVPSNTNVSAPLPPPTKDGYTFYRWATSKDGSTGFDFNNLITAKTDVYASWIADEEELFTITASAGTGGSVSPSGEITVKSGADQQFTITPQEGYQISSVLVDGNEVLNGVQTRDYSKAGLTDAENNVKYYNFENVTSNHTLVASFEAINLGDDDDSNDNNGDDGSSALPDNSGSDNTDDNGGSGGSGGNSTESSGGSDISGSDSADGSSPDNSGNSAPAALSDTSVFTDASVISTSNTAPASKDSEPKTGDASHVEIYATIAMIAGLSYLLLYFADGKSGMTEEEKKEIVASLVNWAKKGNSVKKYAALAVIFLILVYYHSIGKRTTVDWKEVYEK